MSKQIYIDSNGNEIQVSGTVNSADMLPLEAGSSKMTSEAIGSLSSLTTTNQDSLVDAVNEKATVYEIGDINTSTKTITFSSTIRFILFSTGGSNARLTAYLCIGRTSTSFAQPILSGSVVTVNATSNTITITTSADNTRFHMLLLSGSPDDFVIT